MMVVGSVSQLLIFIVIACQSAYCFVLFFAILWICLYTIQIESLTLKLVMYNLSKFLRGVFSFVFMWWKCKGVGPADVCVGGLLECCAQDKQLLILSDLVSHGLDVRWPVPPRSSRDEGPCLCSERLADSPCFGAWVYKRGMLFLFLFSFMGVISVVHLW